MIRFRSLPLAGLSLAVLMTPALAQSREFDLPAFDEIDVGDGISVVLTQGSPQSVRVESSNAGALENLRVDVRDGELRLRFDQSFFDFIASGGIVGALLRGRADMTAYVTVPELEGLDVGAGASVTGDGLRARELEIDVSSAAEIALTGLAVDELDIDLASGSSARLAGQCGTIAAEASSGASLAAEALECAVAEARASSGARIDIFASDRAQGRASSGGTISVHGDPATLSERSSSGGMVRLAD